MLCARPASATKVAKMAILGPFRGSFTKFEGTFQVIDNESSAVIFAYNVALLHDSTAARVGALFQLLVQDTTAQDFGLPSSAIRLRM